MKSKIIKGQRGYRKRQTPGTLEAADSQLKAKEWRRPERCSHVGIRMKVSRGRGSVVAK